MLPSPSARPPAATSLVLGRFQLRSDTWWLATTSPAMRRKLTSAPIITPGALTGMAELAADVYVDALVLDYIARLVDGTRSADEVRLGVSIRGALALTRASRASAAAHGRTYVTPDDVKRLAVAVLAHRLILHPEAEFDGVTQEAVIGQVLLDVPPPTRRESV